MPPVATELDLATESTSEPPRPQPFADTDEHEVPSMCDQPKRKRKAPERFEVDANITSRATGQRWSAQSCCPNHMDAEPSTSEPASAPATANATATQQGARARMSSSFKLHQLRDSAQNRTIINNIDELAAFLEANFKNPTKSYFAKKGGGAIYQRHIHYVKASEIEVTRRDLVHAEYSLKKSDCYRQICDIGEPGVVVCRHRSCHQCRHDHEDEVGGDCIDLDFARCKEEAHCGAPQERALTAVQFEQDEVAMALRALALQEQARRIQSGEIVCVANHDVETKSCLPFLIGKVCQTPLLAFGDSFFKPER
jgi:hypothetical protein